MRHARDPRKIDVFTYFALYTAGPIPYHELSNAGFRPVKTYISENQTKEQYGSKDDAIADGEGTGGSRRSAEQGREVLHDRVRRTGSEGDQEERRCDSSRVRPAGACGSQGAHGPQPGDRRSDQDPGQEGREVPRGQGCEGRDRTAEEEVVDRAYFRADQNP